MKISFEIAELDPVTLNHTHKIANNKRNGKKFMKKTIVYEQFESIFNNKMRTQRVNVNKLNKYFDESKHCLQIDYRFYFPVYTSKGLIGKTSKDVDNIIKPIQDCLFKNFMFDDSLITKVSSEKIHSETSRIEIDIKVLTYR